MRGTLGTANLGFLAAIALIATGCVTLRPYDPGPGKRVMVSVPQSTYVSGGAVNLTISNLSGVSLAYPDRFCTTALQKKSGSAWITVSPPPTRCASSRGFLDPGQTIVYRFALPKDVAEGMYRLTLPMPTPVPDEALTEYDDVDHAPVGAAKQELLTPAFKVQVASR
ncbi:MAG: hypothetical protein ACREMS_04640 [Gemmatimonadaceae bacterium]